MERQLAIDQFQSFGCGSQSGFAFGECETQYVTAECSMMVEAGARHRSNADLVEHEIRRLEIIAKSQVANVCHDVVGALWGTTLKSRRA